MKAFRNIGSFDGRHAFAGWLFTIARHNCIDHYRAAPPAFEEAVPDRADGNDPGEALACREDRDGLWTLARRVLPPAQFQALWLSYAAEMNVKEVARVLNRTSTHIKVMLFRARRALRRALEESRLDALALEQARARPLPASNTAGGAEAPRANKPWTFPAEPVNAGSAGKLGPIPGI